MKGQTMTLTIENVKPEFLPKFKEFAQSLNATITEKMDETEDECPICKAQGYTLSPSAEKRILGAVKEIENKRKNGTLKTYASIDELREALEA